ncbi:hypothetical protein FXO37_33620 [Capsicum annuum]|nr:hypothetical protein FXO37_33620 [Capsicum annuum]
MPNVEMRDADKAPAASEEKLLLSKFYLDEIKSFVRTYVDMKFNDLQKLMVNQYTGFLGVVKDCFASFGKHTADAKSYNVVDVAGQSSKLGVNEGPNEESLKALQYFIITLTSHFKYVTRESEEALHNTDENLSKAILYVPPSRATYPTGINYEDAATIDKLIGKATLIVIVILATTILQLFLRKGKDEYYTTKQADLKPTLDFVVAHPVKKSWFYFMAQSSNYWNDEHIEVVFYYLRKKAKMDTTSEYRYTTVNCIFMNYIYDTYTQYHQSHSEIDLSSHVENIRSMKVASVDRSICEIMQGLCISAGIPCHLIDEVYVPINCKGSFHWVLAVIVLKKRCIRVYDSMKGHRGHADEIKEHAEMLSTYLTISDFFEKEDRTDWSFLDVYKEKTD